VSDEQNTSVTSKVEPLSRRIFRLLKGFDLCHDARHWINGLQDTTLRDAWDSAGDEWQRWVRKAVGQLKEDEVTPEWRSVFRELPELALNEHAAFLLLLHAERPSPVARALAHPADAWTIRSLARIPRARLAHRGRRPGLRSAEQDGAS